MLENEFSENADRTAETVFRMRQVNDRIVEELEAELGRLILRDLVVFSQYLVPLSTRDRRAAIYMLISHVRAALTELELAAESIALGEHP